MRGLYDTFLILIVPLKESQGMEIVLKSGDLTRLFSDSMETRGTIYVTGVSGG